MYGRCRGVRWRCGRGRRWCSCCWFGALYTWWPDWLRGCDVVFSVHCVEAYVHPCIPSVARCTYLRNQPAYLPAYPQLCRVSCAGARTLGRLRGDGGSARPPLLLAQSFQTAALGSHASGMVCTHVPVQVRHLLVAVCAAPPGALVRVRLQSKRLSVHTADVAPQCMLVAEACMALASRQPASDMIRS